MNLNEISKLGLTKQGLLGSFGGRLYLAFGAIILLTLITTALSLYSFNRFGDVVQRTTTETIPLVVGAKDLAERSLSLTASAQSIALAGDKNELQASMADLDALLREIKEAVGRLIDRSDPDVLNDIREDIEALATILEALEGLAEQRFIMQQRHDVFVERVNEVGANFADTSHPVTYGVHSLMGLFANRAGRRTTKRVEHLGSDVHRPVTIIMAARRTMESIKASASPVTGGKDRMPWLRRSLLTIITNDLESLSRDATSPELSELARMASELRDRESVGNDELERFAGRLDEQVERERQALIDEHRRVALETRQTIIRLIDMAVKEGGVSTEIRALGIHVISLLNTVAVLESTEAVYEMRVGFDRSFDALRDVLGAFEKSALAQRNPILAANLRKIEEDLVQLRHGDMDPFQRRTSELSLLNEIANRLAEGREVSSRLTLKVNQLVTGIMAEVEQLGFDADRQRLTNSTIIAFGGAFSVLVIVAIALYTAAISRRHEADLHGEIHERRRTEEALRQRTAQLEAANVELDAFVYSVSHDLRAPLRGLSGFSQALMEDYADKLDGDALDYLTRISRASQRMGQMIDDLLTLSRATRGELRWEQVDLTALAESIVAELDERNPGRQVSCEIAPQVITQGDPRVLRIVLENLLHNAWKFTSKHERATIDFGTRRLDDDRVYFVRDDGVGFDMTYVDKLFGIFQRLHAITEFEGTGIGLATVARLIHRHGGRVWAEGAVEQGATFYFTLGNPRREEPKTWHP
ncbi:MAG: ATP-binding protein [Desulfobacterales bacterium]|jgi:signal transduction histidine kinase